LIRSFQYLIFIFYSKKSKPTDRHHLPSLYVQTLINSESDYQREITHKLDRIQHDNQDIVRRRLANHHLFALGHLKKRHHWFSVDKSYRDNCRTMWNKQTNENTRQSHIFLPSIYPKENSSSIKNTFQIEKNDDAMIADEKIKKKFLYTQPVLLEILNAPHAYKIVKNKRDIQLCKTTAQRQHIQIQTNAVEDQRYTELVSLLETN
jgi:hypothetical protein